MTMSKRLEFQFAAATLAVGVAGCSSGELRKVGTVRQGVEPRGQLYISEVMYQADPLIRYIELYNASPSSVNLNGHELRVYADGNGGDSCTVRQSLTGTIAPGAALVFVNGADQMSFTQRFRL
jgi:lamin tail-like protein